MIKVILETKLVHIK